MLRSLLLVFILSLAAGCSIFDPNALIIPDIVTRSMTPNVIVNNVDSGYPWKQGFNINDALVLSLVSDGNAMARALISKLNGETNAEALGQTLLGATVAGLALGKAPIAAAGGVGLTALFLGRIFSQANSPAHANALNDFVKRNTDLQNAYWGNLQAETCSNGQVSGTKLSNAGSTLLVGFNSSVTVLESVRQGLMPTLAALQAATAPVSGTFYAFDVPCQPQASAARLSTTGRTVVTTTTTTNPMPPSKITVIKPDIQGNYTVTVTETIPGNLP